MPDQITVADLDAFAAAFNRHDLETILSMMTPDCVFEASAGDAICGTRHVGQTSVGAAFQEVFDAFPDATWSNPRHFIAGDRGVSEWTFSGTRSDGSRVEVHGCDVFSFEGGKIAVKNSFRKQRPPIST
jgi:ketosteroid isomerase-like protein